MFSSMIHIAKKEKQPSADQQKINLSIQWFTIQQIKRKEVLMTRYKIDEPRKHNGAQKTPYTQGHISHDFIYIKFPEHANPERQKGDVGRWGKVGRWDY